MYSKILHFNKTLFKKDFNMVKWIVFFVAGILFLNITAFVISRSNSFNNLENYYIEEGIEYNRDDIIERFKTDVSWKFTDWEATVVLIVLVPIALVAALFGEEKRRKTFEILMVMPYSRYEIFFNKLLVALLAMVLPFIINGLIMILALGFSSNLRMFYSVGQVIKWILLFFYYQLPILSFTLIFGTITGTTVSQMILTFIFLIFPAGFSLLINLNLECLGLLKSWDPNIILNKIVEYSPIGALDSIHKGYKHYIIYILLSIAMIILAKILFDKNKIERNGETLEFENTEKFFKIGVSICTALLVALIFVWIFNDFAFITHAFQIFIMIVGYIVGGILGYIAARFSIKVNRSKA